MIRRIGLYAVALLVIAGGVFMRETIRVGVRTAIDYVTGAGEAEAAPAPATKPTNVATSSKDTAAKGKSPAAPTTQVVSAPPMSGPKRAAENAAAKVNARTAAQVDAAAERPATTGAATNTGAANTAAPRGASATAPAAPERSAPARRTGPTTVAVATPAAQPAASASAAETPEREVSFEREVFVYDAAGRRDPFVSLLSSGDLRPVFTDLRLVGVIYDPTGRRPVAVMRDVTTNDQYRVTTGQVLGRMRVAQIEPKAVLFTIEEFGFSRQERLALGDSSRARGQ